MLLLFLSVAIHTKKMPPLLEMVQRASSGKQQPEAEAGTQAGVDNSVAENNPMASESMACQGTTASPRSSDRHKPPHELNVDGIVLRLAIWSAAVIDNEHVSLDMLIACLVVGMLLCCALVGFVCCVLLRMGREAHT